jgi:hypothetical protein
VALSREDVPSGIPSQPIVALATIDLVVSPTTANQVATILALDPIVAAQGHDHVASISPSQSVPLVRADDCGFPPEAVARLSSGLGEGGRLGQRNDRDRDQNRSQESDECRPSGQTSIPIDEHDGLM